MGSRLLAALSMCAMALALAYALTVGVFSIYIPIELRPLAKILVTSAYNESTPLFSSMTPEIVTAVVWDYRGIDTFFEVAVFYVAIVATAALFRGIERSAPRTSVGLSTIVRTVTRIVALMIVVVGSAIILHGHLTPGGGFQGGATIAVAVALALVAYGLAKLVEHRIDYETSLKVRSLGLLGLSLSACIALIAALILNTNAYVFQNQPKTYAPIGLPYAVDGVLISGTVLLLNIFDGIAVAAGFALLLILLSQPEDVARERVLSSEGGE